MHELDWMFINYLVFVLQAAVFGAGCWAERSADGRRVACSVSGQGELIVQSFLAKTLAERTAASTADDTHDILRSVLVDDFYGALPPPPFFFFFFLPLTAKTLAASS
jgi:hypothetical protein